MSKPLLLFEFCALFVAMPLAFRFAPLQIPPLPVLWAAALYCFWVLKSDPSFPVGRLWNAAAILAQLGSIAAIFAVLGGLIVLSVRWLAPEMALSFVRHRPGLWALVMILYPVLSVYPQSLVYRAFLMQRYLPLLQGAWRNGTALNVALILLSAACFAFMHLIFRNSVAVSFTFVGGLLFAWRYLETGSLAASAFEHALYGCLLFTAGLGQYFYHGRIRLQ